jgi:predicted dehydrogenase
MKKIKIGVIGCGNISGIYLQKAQTFSILEVAACTDLIPERAQAQGAKYGVPAVSVEQLLADPEIEIVVNLTIPLAHYNVALQALQAGKSVYNEKPLTVRREQAEEILDLAKAKGLLIGCAPDTFLGAGLQTCRQVIDSGRIGYPVAATAYMLNHGHEGWHPDPEFYYKLGGGPMFDMGPYYLTALVHLLGPVDRVTGSTRKSFDTRTIRSQPKNGQVITVDTPTHIVGVLDFASGCVGNIITSFDVWHHMLPTIEIYGSEGTLRVPDPNSFGGSVEVRLAGEDTWQPVPHTHGYAENSRSLGVADMAHALRSGRPQRASGALAYHVLDIMHAVHDASATGKHLVLTSQCDRPASFPTGLQEGVLDD